MLEVLAKAKFEKEVANLSDVFLKSRGWVVNNKVFPILDVTMFGKPTLRVRLECDEWNELPPSATLLCENGDPLQLTRTVGCFHEGPHDRNGKPGPFICMRGFREYHTHGSHLNEHWETYKNQDGNGLIGLLDQVNRHWKKVPGHE